jgi:hypothetical protein
MKPGMYNMTPEPISVAYFINLSASQYVYPAIVARQLLSKKLCSGKEYTPLGKLLDELFCMRSLSYEKEMGNNLFPEYLVEFQSIYLHAFLFTLMRGICAAYFIFQYSLHLSSFRRRVQTGKFLVMYSNVFYFAVAFWLMLSFFWSMQRMMLVYGSGCVNMTSRKWMQLWRISMRPT